MVYHRDDTGQVHLLRFRHDYHRSPWQTPEIWPIQRPLRPKTFNPEKSTQPLRDHGTRDWTVEDPELKRLVGCFVGRLSRPYGLSQTAQEEICQEVFLRLLQKQDPSKPDPRFCSSFLFQTARNVVRETSRKSSRIDHREISMEIPSSEDSDTASRWEKSAVSDCPDPHRSSLSREIRRAIRHCLSRLKTERRRAVTLRLLGFRVKEIADCFEWSPRSAEGRILGGLKQLRTCLRSKGIEP